MRVQVHKYAHLQQGNDFGHERETALIGAGGKLATHTGLKFTAT